MYEEVGRRRRENAAADGEGGGVFLSGPIKSVRTVRVLQRVGEGEGGR